MAAAAEKQRRYRERLKDGRRVLRGSLAVDGESLARLCEAGLMPADRLQDDEQALDVISAFLDFCSMDRTRRALAAVMLSLVDEFE